MTPAPPSTRCQRCGAPSRLAGPDGECPGCLLASALDIPACDSEEEVISLEHCDGYALEEVIGRGGTGIVYRARREGDGKVVALKMLAAASRAGEDDVRRFRLEIESAMALDHPHIVRILGSGESTGVPYFVMEHASGGNLAVKIEDRGGRGVESAVREDAGLVVKLARAVHFAHERGILHRDLKPANILIDARGEPLVSDFGLVRLLHSPSGVTMTGLALGTPAYMAPEQAAGRNLTTSADIFSLGAILYHLLTGRPPFGEGTPLEILRRAASEEAPDPRLAAPWLDRDLATVVLTALRREPSRRYAAAADLAADLERWANGDAVSARPLSRRERTSRWMRRHPAATAFALTGTVAGMFLMALGLVGFVIVREERNRALAEEAKARESARLAGETRDEFQQHSYAADIYQAFRAFDDGHLGQARHLLERHLPRDSGKDVRGFEWHVLHRLCQGNDLKSWQDHSAAVVALALSPDGRTFASGGREGRIVLRGFPGGDEKLRIPPAGTPEGVAELPLMTTVTGRSGELRKQVLGGGLNPDELRMLGRPSKLGELVALAWSPGGEQLLSACMGSYVRLWKLPEGKLDGLIPEKTVTDAAFTSDGKWIVLFAATDLIQGLHEVRIYASDSLELARVIPGVHKACAFSAATNRIAVRPRNGTRVEFHDPAGLGSSYSWDAGVPLDKLVMSGSGSVIAGRDPKDGAIILWNAADGVRAGELKVQPGSGRSFVPSPDGKQVATWGAGQTVSVHAVDGSSAPLLLRGHENAIRSAVFSASGEYLLTGGNDGSTRLWPGSIAKGIPTMASNPIPQRVTSGMMEARGPQGLWSGDGRRDGKIRLERHDGSVLNVAAPPETYFKMVPSPDGRFLGALSWPRVLRVLDTTSLSWSAPIRLSAGTVGPVVFSPDGEWIASGGDDHLIALRNSSSGETVASWAAHQGTILALCFSPDARTLVSSAKDGTIRLWHTPTWRDLGVLHRGEDVTGLEFQADGVSLKMVTAAGGEVVLPGE